jgi:hypothetical protein
VFGRKGKLNADMTVEPTAAPVWSLSIAGFGDSLWSPRVAVVITAGRLSLSSPLRAYAPPFAQSPDFHSFTDLFHLTCATERYPGWTSACARGSRSCPQPG